MEVKENNVMKTPEELTAIKEEVEILGRKLAELTDDELAEVTGGMKVVVIDDDPEETSWWEKFLKLFFKT